LALRKIFAACVPECRADVNEKNIGEISGIENTFVAMTMRSDIFRLADIKIAGKNSRTLFT